MNAEFAGYVLRLPLSNKKKAHDAIMLPGLAAPAMRILPFAVAAAAGPGWLASQANGSAECEGCDVLRHVDGGGGQGRVHHVRCAAHGLRHARTHPAPATIPSFFNL